MRGAGEFILEPFLRSTAPAIAFAARKINKLFGSDSIILVLSADHLIADEHEFAMAVERALKIIVENPKYLITFGIVPDRPETGYGYLKIGSNISEGIKVDQFVEKPDQIKAEEYIKSEGYLWNSGIFCFSTQTILSELEKHAPEVANLSKEWWDEIQNKGSGWGDIEISEDRYINSPEISIDHAVMEKSNNIVAVLGKFGWSDIGNWKAMSNLAVADEDGNKKVGDVTLVKCRNVFARGGRDRLIAAIGIQDLTIIDSKDALLIMPRSDGFDSDIKELVTNLKKDKHRAAQGGMSVIRPWGKYTILHESNNFKVKKIDIVSGGCISLQYHHYRSEHWVVVSGEATVTIGDKISKLQENQSIYIGKKIVHRLENKTDKDLVIVEIQCGDYLGEDDIVRLQDNYGRK